MHTIGSHCNNAIDVFSILLSEGADINEALVYSALDYIGEPFLHRAVWFGNIKIVKFILEHGGNVNLMSKWGTTPLDETQEIKQKALREKMIALLKKYGAKKGVRWFSKFRDYLPHEYNYKVKIVNGVVTMTAELLLSVIPKAILTLFV